MKLTAMVLALTLIAGCATTPTPTDPGVPFEGDAPAAPVDPVATNIVLGVVGLVLLGVLSASLKVDRDDRYYRRHRHYCRYDCRKKYR
jgi:hypothetical protein